MEYPKVHDVGDILEYYSNSFPEWFKKEIPKIRQISRELSLKRIPSVYGIEKDGKPASELFDEKDAKEALENAKSVHNPSQRFIKKFYEKTDQ